MGSEHLEIFVKKLSILAFIDGLRIKFDLEGITA